MACCEACGKEMLKAKGCAVHVYEIMDNGVWKKYKRIPYGDIKDNGETFALNGYRCPDCGAKPGGYHHPGCDMETCPRCGMQMLSCDCDARWKIHTHSNG